MIDEKFKKQITRFKAPAEVRFLLNVLNLILHNGLHYCFCEKLEGLKLVYGSQRQGAMCRIFKFFSEFKKDLDVNQFDHQFQFLTIYDDQFFLKNFLQEQIINKTIEYF